jgi:hypothetical protein
MSDPHAKMNQGTREKEEKKMTFGMYLKMVDGFVEKLTNGVVSLSDLIDGLVDFDEEYSAGHSPRSAAVKILRVNGFDCK